MASYYWIQLTDQPQMGKQERVNKLKRMCTAILQNVPSSAHCLTLVNGFWLKKQSKEIFIPSLLKNKFWLSVCGNHRENQSENSGGHSKSSEAQLTKICGYRINGECQICLKFFYRVHVIVVGGDDYCWYLLDVQYLINCLFI